MAANATAEVEGQKPTALAAKELIDAMAAPTAVVDAQVAIGKDEEDVMAATAATEEHSDTATAAASMVSTPSRGCRATIATNELAVLPAAWATYLLLLFWINCA